MGNIDIIRRCQLGDEQSFNELYELYRKKALGTAYLISGQKGIADDIVQEAFIECFKKINRLKSAEAFEVWFYKILVRTGWRMVKNYNRFFTLAEQKMEELDEGRDHASNLVASETNIMLQEAIEKLSLPLKTVVVLYYFADLSIEEISTILGCMRGTVKSRLFNARKQLYGMLSDNITPEQTGRGFVCERKEFELNGRNA